MQRFTFHLRKKRSSLPLPLLISSFSIKFFNYNAGKEKKLQGTRRRLAVERKRDGMEERGEWILITVSGPGFCFFYFYFYGETREGGEKYMERGGRH